MTHFLYNLLLTGLLLFYVPYRWIQVLLGKRPRSLLKERLGGYPDLASKRPLWVHAASVGEVLCCIPLLKRIRTEIPDLTVLLTTMTSTGRETAKRLLPEIDGVLYFPLDHPLLIRRVLKRLNPRLLMIAETELWPNLLVRSGRRSLPVVLFNGRISERSLRGYLWLRPFFKRSLHAIQLFLMQTEEDRGRIITIGAPPERTEVVGNIKFDQIPPPLETESIQELLASLKLQGNEPLLIAGSTHAGEEEILLDVFQDLRKAHPSLTLLLAPRHLDRLAQVEKLLIERDLPWERRSHRSAQKGSEAKVILLDTMGELMKLYRLGTLVFIGGSLVSIGGHNPLEPLFYKRCVLFGPYMFNFLEISRRLTAEGGAVLVKDKEDLSAQLRRLLSDEKTRREIGEKGFQFLQRHRGATDRIVDKIRPFLL
ncbi:MAG: 3-deoxy-D-manno-octulosonic acid transferase [Desulfobacterota bacterium]|nr:3-deoxy-D-manno-octulosonic acid transferase [Thermodesulfobacteriota bacterium]